MGISNKIATKIRTAAKTTIVPLPQPYEDVGSVAAAAIIRAAASTISQLRLTSYTTRGQDFMRIKQSRSTYLSTVEVGQQGQRMWSVSLGVPTVSGWTADWLVRIVLENGPEGITASVTTPATLTNDGTLVNKSAHAELRDLLLSGLRAGQLPGGTAEVAVSRAGLAADQLEPYYASVAGTTLRTKLRPDEIMMALSLIPFSVADRRPGGVRWRLDTVGSLAGRFAAGTITDDGAARVLTLRCVPQPHGNAVIDAMAAKRGVVLFDAVTRAVNRFDPDFERTGEPVSYQRPMAG